MSKTNQTVNDVREKLKVFDFDTHGSDVILSPNDVPDQFCSAEVLNEFAVTLTNIRAAYDYLVSGLATHDMLMYLVNFRNE